MKKLRIIAMLLAAVLLLSCFAGCAKKPGTNSDPNSKQENGTDTPGKEKEKDKGKDKDKNKDNTPKSQINAKYAYKSEFKDIPLETNYINATAVSGDMVYFLAEIVDGQEEETYSWTDENGEVHEEHYTYDTYRNGLFRMDLKSGEVHELENFRFDEVPEGWDGSSYVQALKAGTDGTLWALYNCYCYRYNLPENFDPNTMQEWEYYEYKDEYNIVHLAADGTTLMTLKPQAPESAGEEYNSYVGSFLVDDRGYVYASDYTYIYLFDANGQQIAAVSSENGGDLCQYSADQIGVVSYVWDEATETSSRWFVPLDPETKTWGEKIKMPYNVYEFYPGDDVYDLYYVLNGTIMGYDTETGAQEKVVDWMDCDINYYDLNGFNILPDGRVIAVRNTWDGNTGRQNAELIVLTRVDASTLPEKTVLTLACNGLGWDLRQSIIDYNKTSETHRIVVKDYSEYNTDEDWQAGVKKLNTEIMAGTLPDILCGDSYSLPLTRYAARGLLTDLYALIDADPNISREDFIPSLLKALETDGKLYRIADTFEIATAAALTKVVQDYPVWDLAALKDAMTRLQPGARVCDYYMAQTDVLDMYIYGNMNSFVNWQTGECSFNSPEFINLLEFCKTFPTQYDWENHEYTQEDDSQYALTHGLQLLYRTWIYSMQSYTWDAMALGDVTFVGRPSENGASNNAFQLNTTYAITNACADQAAAWSFIFALLQPEEVSDEDYYGDDQFSVLKSGLDRAVAYFTTEQLMLDADGNTVDWDMDGQPDKRSKGGYSYQDENGEWQYVTLYSIPQEQVDKVLDLIANTTTLAEYDTEIQNIIADDMTAFLAGDRSAQDTANMIQNRVWLYIQEQR